MDSNTYLRVGKSDVLANRLDRVGAPSCYILHVRTVSIVYDMSDIYVAPQIGMTTKPVWGLPDLE